MVKIKSLNVFLYKNLITQKILL
jgi:F-type H+-transporting ATPase subunit c